ncbi:hypothetical protein [Aliikangiella coralliicola]|uniref:Uncharacterized protein n=1 Tax=Aliikangiella coralliicola TaxID=2592383 RepID=A0A545UCW1_9GAMM|nr:hypothetical protein [Aliikangiella coralliicola]TQV87306.1 hypothetical protein FLL46_12720 [Aliikangiella coralliicola]
MESSCCNTKTVMPEVKTVSIPVKDIMQDLSADLPNFSWGGNTVFEDTDPVIHRLVGNVNNVPFEHFKMISFRENAMTEEWDERKFIGKISNEPFDYTLSVKKHDSLFDISATIREPAIPDMPNISITLDPQSGKVISTCPNILDLPEDNDSFLDPVSTMVFLASNRQQEYNKTCLITVLGFTFLSCGPLLLAPGVGTAAFVLCAGPALAAAVIGCKKKP